MTWAQIVPLIFMGLLGFALFIYVVLDGFDLGVGMLMHRANTEERNIMVAVSSTNKSEFTQIN